MTKQKAWRLYFETGDREPLIRAYWDNVNYIAWSRFPAQKEDMFQVGMIGLLKALDRLDIKRVKSPDAWIYLNVRGAMLNERQFETTTSLDDVEWNYLVEDHIDTDVDVKIALGKVSLESTRKYLSGYQPETVSKEKILQDYNDGNLSIREVARSLGISRRQAYKLIDKMPDSW